MGGQEFNPTPSALTVHVLPLAGLREHLRALPPLDCGCPIESPMPNIAQWPMQTALVSYRHTEACAMAGSSTALGVAVVYDADAGDLLALQN